MTTRPAADPGPAPGIGAWLVRTLILAGIAPSEIDGLDVQVGMDLADWALARSGMPGGPWTPSPSEWQRLRARPRPRRPGDTGISIGL